MITSQEINAMISMQGQGVGYTGMPVAGPVPGASQYPPQFSYAAPTMTGSAIGRAAAGGLMNSFGPTAGGLSSAAFNTTAIAGLGAMGAGMLGMGTVADASKGIQAAGLAGRLGAIESSAFLGNMARLNPVNSMIMSGGAAAATAFKAGGLLGTGGVFTGAGLSSIGAGAIAGLANPYAIAGMILAAPALGMFRGAQQYNETANMLGTYNQFANPFAASGRGFSDTQMSGMVSQMRAFQAESPFISMRDMQQSMARFNEMGMNQGERDAQEFAKKFTQMAKTVTAMSKAMGTTMDEASKVFAQMRSVGFYTGADVAGNTLRTMTLRGEGISGATTLGAQGTGGGITRAGGLGTTPGAKAVGGVMSMFTGARGVGALSNEEMMNITGAATPEQAIAQLSTNVTTGLTNFYMGTGPGQALLAALGATDKSGAFTGELDADMVEKLRSGKININNLTATGREKVKTRNAALSFKTKGQDVAGALLSQGDPTAAIGALMQSIAGDKFQDMDPENLITMLVEGIQGMSRKEAEALTKLYREGDKIRRESQRQLRSEMQAEIFMTDVKERHSFEGFRRRFMGGISDMFAPLNEFGHRVNVGFGGMVQGVEDTIFSTTRVGSTDELRQRSIDALISPPSADSVSGLSTNIGLADAALNERLIAGSLLESDIQLTEKGKEYADLLSKPSRDIDSFMPTDKLSPEVVGQALREGKTVQEYLLSLEVGRKGSGHTERAVRVADVLAAGGQEAEDLKQALAVAAIRKGSTAAAQGVAYLSDTGTVADTLEGRTQAIKDIIGKDWRGSFWETDQQDYESMMTGRNSAVLSAIGGRMDVAELKQVYDSALATGKDPIEVLKEKGITGLSAGDIQDFLKWAEKTDNLSITKQEAKQISELSFGSQQIMDMSNLAATAQASAEVAGSETVGAAKIRNLARQAGSGGVESTRAAIEELIDELESKGLTAGDLSSKEYGALTGSLGRALSKRRLVDASTSDEERKKILSDFGFSEEALSRVNLSDKEAVKEIIGRASIQGDAVSSGGAFTDTSQAEAVKYYKQLADSVSALSGQILIMQERERAYQAERTTQQPPPAGGTGSLRKLKYDIQYLSPEEIVALHGAVLRIPVATWRYKNSDPDTAPRLGFIIDDCPTIPAVAVDGEHVDVYGLATMAIAAVQAQQAEIEELRARLALLENTTTLPSTGTSGLGSGEGDYA